MLWCWRACWPILNLSQAGPRFFGNLAPLRRGFCLAAPCAGPPSRAVCNQRCGSVLRWWACRLGSRQVRLGDIDGPKLSPTPLGGAFSLPGAEIGQIPETPPGAPTGLGLAVSGGIAAKLAMGQRGSGGCAVHLANHLVARRSRKVQGRGSSKGPQRLGGPCRGSVFGLSK